VKTFAGTIRKGMAFNMARENQTPDINEEVLNKKQIRDEKKKLKEERKQQKKEAKQKAKELASQEAELDDDESRPVSTVLITLIIVLVWLGILALLIKLDVGGFGSDVLRPLMKDIPVVSMILPEEKMTGAGTTEEEDYYGYSSLKEAVEQIKVLEEQLAQAQTAGTTYTEDIESLKAEIDRLKTFEDNQVEFERIKNEFYEEVIYAENGPGAEEYKKYYESMDPTTAEYLYKQVVVQLEESKEVTDYANAYSEMKPKEAAAIFEAMTDNLDLAARILGVMDTQNRGKILGAMDPIVASKITKIMEPDS